MSNYTILRPDHHQNLCVDMSRSAALGDEVSQVLTYPLEFRDIQSCYPIFFTKDSETGAFMPVALLGLNTGQNLFMINDAWDAHYIPKLIERNPFLIARPANANPNQTPQPKLSIDLDSPRVTEDRGEALFDSAGAPTDFLENIIAMMQRIHQGLEHGAQLSQALVAHELLEPMTVNLTLADGESKVLEGFYAIAEETLFNLSGEALQTLNQAGFLQPIYMAIASFSRLNDLMARSNSAKQQRAESL